MVLTHLANVFMADQCIAALEQEIFMLWSAKKNFNRVEISWPAPKSTPKANKLAQTNLPQTPEDSDSSPKPKPMEQPKSMSAQPPVRTPFRWCLWCTLQTSSWAKLCCCTKTSKG
jgi:hypothetical protein